MASYNLQRNYQDFFHPIWLSDKAAFKRAARADPASPIERFEIGSGSLVCKIPRTLSSLLFLGVACTVPNPNYRRPSDGGVDGGADLRCNASEHVCGGACVDTTTSGDHCGACGHSCGGGTCSASLCSPVTAWASIREPNDFAIDATSLYVTYEDKVASCPLAGCAGTQPTQIASTAPTGHWPTGEIRVSNGRVYFVGSPDRATIRYAIYTCPIAGCPVTIPIASYEAFSPPSAMSVVGDTVTFLDPDGGLSQVNCAQGVCGTRVFIASKPLSGIATDANFIYTVDTSTPNSTPLLKCPVGAPNCTRTIVSGDGRYPSRADLYHQLVAHAGIIYINGTGRLSAGNGIYMCPVGGCTTATEFQSSFRPFPDLKVDDSGVYWIDGATNSEIHRCPLDGCTGGVKKVYVAAAESSIKRLWIDQHFIYWMEHSPGEGGMIGAVKRLAK